MLPDHEIRKSLDLDIYLDPIPPDQCFQPASVDLALGNHFRVYGADGAAPVVMVNDRLVIKPGQCWLATTKETVGISNRMSARFEGKSTWGRRFLLVHATAGFIDPGFCGEITLELVNLGPAALTLYAGESIGQVSFTWLDSPSERSYGEEGLGNHYQGQVGATAAAA